MKKLEDLVFQIRRDIVRMVNEVNSGHPGGSLGCTEFFIVLFFKIMNRRDDFDMNGKDEDLFFLSNGHISPVYYSTLARAGYFDIKELSTFRKIASGSLGQGMSVAIGAAISKKLNNDRNIIYSLHGDGELQEGQNWEAIMFASANKIDNIICTIDYNQKQIDGDLKEVLDLGDIPQKFKSFNWHVIKLLDGNNLKKVEEALISAKKLTGNGKPVAIIMNTIMGNGVDYMMGSHKWHGVAPNNEELKIALDQNPETLKDY